MVHEHTDTTNDPSRPLNKGDLIVLKNLKKRYGVVIDAESSGHVTIQWRDGSKSVTYYTTIIHDSNHEVIRAS
tara:strand:+ start:43 stop:261 length:219 start_codon:yes stop_codon:yes gene_type:complete